jgi:hypothetical protein
VASPVSVVRERLELVEDLMAQGYSRTQVARKLGLKQRTTDRYRAVITARWHQRYEEERPQQMERMLGRLERLARKMEVAGAWGPRAQVERLMADIRGVRAPEKLQVQAQVVSIDGATTIGLSKLTDTQFDALQAAYTALALGPHTSEE